MVRKSLNSLVRQKQACVSLKTQASQAKKAFNPSKDQSRQEAGNQNQPRPLLGIKPDLQSKPIVRQKKWTQPQKMNPTLKGISLVFNS